tara:strand:+ start:16827 stop:18002 length:1176 start_codon:yes stop_codon:yes gene_type:complete
MSDMTYAHKVMNSLLMEAKLVDSFNYLVAGSVVRLTTIDGKEGIFFVTKNEGGRIVMKDKATKINYTFTKNSLTNNVLTLNSYDENADNNEGAARYYELKDFSIGKGSGDVEQIDLIDGDLTKRMADMNNIIKSVKKGELLLISSEENHTGDDEDGLVNTIILKVKDVEPKQIVCVLDDIEVESPSIAMDKLGNAFRNRTIYIEINDLVKIDGDGLTLNMKTANNIFPLTGLIAIEKKGVGEDEDDGLTKQELVDKIKLNPEFMQAIDKTPSFWDQLFNASPKGVNQLDNLLNTSKISNTYLSVGDYVRFKLLSPAIFINSDAKLKNNQIYNGKIEKNLVLKYGTRKQGHWELKIIKQISDTEYKVKISYLNKDLVKIPKGDGVVKIVDNG